MPPSPLTTPVGQSRYASERALRRLELQIVRRLDGFLHGEHLGLLPGPGTDAAEARPYVPGEDDVRRIDWSVTARTTVAHVRDLVADRELETWAVVDLSASMAFGTAAMEKRDLAISAVATMGLLTFRAGDRFGGYILDGRGVKRWPARSGRLALFALLRSLTRQRAETANGAAQQSLAETLATVARTQRKRGLRVVVSDFIDARDACLDVDIPAPWEKAMRELSLRHQVVAVEIVDPRELDIPNVGIVQLQDPETGQVRELNTARRKVRQRYAIAARAQRERTARALRRAGVAHLVLRTDRDWITDVARFALSHRRVAGRLHDPRRGGAGRGATR
ncbi:MAG: DUF58 domain-containing protein [Propionibacteriales bacterium]|nr:DUF58 domain-containing protein [Propionibacteriales bacterium]